MAGSTVFRRYLPKTVTVAANTTPAVPLVTNVGLDGTVVLEQVEVVIPTGHAGTTGIAFLMSGKPIIPWSTAVQWVVGDGQDLFFDVGMETDGPVVVWAYNTDQVVHSFYLRLRVSDPVRASASPVVNIQPITAGA